MSFLGLLNQTLIIYPTAQYNSQGREVVGNGTSVSARVEETTRRKLAPTGSLITIDAIAYVESSVSVSTDDRVAYGGQQFKVYGKYSVVDGDGITHHIKLELIKWRET